MGVKERLKASDTLLNVPCINNLGEFNIAEDLNTNAFSPPISGVLSTSSPSAACAEPALLNSLSQYQDGMPSRLVIITLKSFVTQKTPENSLTGFSAFTIARSYLLNNYDASAN